MTSLSLVHQRKNKTKQNNNNKLSRNLTLYEAYKSHCTNLRRAEIKRNKEFNPEGLEKGTLNTINYLKKIMKRQRNTEQMKEQTRNTEVQINEEQIGKPPEKEFRIMTVKMINSLENIMEKLQESINKDLEELKNKHTETSNTTTEIKKY